MPAKLFLVAHWRKCIAKKAFKVFFDVFSFSARNAQNGGKDDFEREFSFMLTSHNEISDSPNIFVACSQ